MKNAVALAVAIVLLAASPGCSGNSAKRAATNKAKRMGASAVQQQRAAADVQRQNLRTQAIRGVQRADTAAATWNGYTQSQPTKSKKPK